MDPTATSVVSKSSFTAEDYTDTTLYGKLFRPAIFLSLSFYVVVQTNLTILQRSLDLLAFFLDLLG